MGKGRVIKLHRIDGDQVVNLPRGFASGTEWVTIKREGDQLIITPADKPGSDSVATKTI